jgi:hypothetical protein
MKQTYKTIIKDIDQNDKNYCTVLAVAIAMDLPFKKVQKGFFELGRKRNKGFYFFDNWKRVAKKFNIKYEILAGSLTDVEMRYHTTLTANNCTDYLDLDTYILGCRGHVFAVKNGSVEDWTKGRKHRVNRVIRIINKKPKVKELNSWDSGFDLSKY